MKVKSHVIRPLTVAEMNSLITTTPKMATNSKPQTTVFTDREATRMKRPIIHVDTLKVVLRAAKKATGNAMIKISGGGAIERGAGLGWCVEPQPLLEN